MTFDEAKRYFQRMKAPQERLLPADWVNLGEHLSALAAEVERRTCQPEAPANGVQDFADAVAELRSLEWAAMTEGTERADKLRHIRYRIEDSGAVIRAAERRALERAATFLEEMQGPVNTITAIQFAARRIRDMIPPD